MHIRAATSQDRNHVQQVHRCAFPDSEAKSVGKLAADLLASVSKPRTISLVAEVGGKVVGHVAFSPVRIEAHDSCQGYILAPLGVLPGFQRRRVGSRLVDYGIEQLTAMGVNCVFVYGDPDYYGRFGFSAEASDRYKAPYELQYPFGWQAIELDPCDIKNPPAALRCVTPLCDPALW